MPTFQSDDVTIYYEIHGEGFPLVLTYGLGGSTKYWGPNIDGLASRYQLILWDHRGHGKSDKPANQDAYGLQTFATDLKNLLDHLEIEKAHIGGQSLGAGSAVRLCLNHSDMAASLLLIASASASGLPQPPAMLEMRHRTIKLALEHGMEAVADEAHRSNLNMISYTKQGWEQQEIVRQMYLDCDANGYAHSVWSLISADPIADRLNEIKVPTLIMAGTGDPVMKAVEATVERIPHGKFVTIPDASHFSNLDNPAEFNRHILEFLKEVDDQ